jgi:hypothetical protein
MHDRNAVLKPKPYFIHVEETLNYRLPSLQESCHLTRFAPEPSPFLDDDLYSL